MPAGSEIVRLTAPDIARYRDGNTGIPYVTTLDSARPGPHALITAVTHGNELCGAVALDWLFRNEIRPTRGKLTLGFVNYAACLAFDPARPGASRFVEEDLNRLWDEETLDGNRRSAELDRARALRPAVDRADFLLDLHSMSAASPPLILAGMLDRSIALARSLAISDYLIRDEGHAAGRRMRDYGGFADANSPKTALLVECGQHWQPESAEIAIAACLRFLAVLEMIEPAEANRFAVPRMSAARIITVTEAVTVAGSDFTFAADYKGMEVIAKKGTLIGRDGMREVRTPYDECVLVMPSGNLTRGQTAVRLGRFTG